MNWLPAKFSTARAAMRPHPVGRVSQPGIGQDAINRLLIEAAKPANARCG